MSIQLKDKKITEREFMRALRQSGQLKVMPGSAADIIHRAKVVLGRKDPLVKEVLANQHKFINSAQLRQLESKMKAAVGRKSAGGDVEVSGYERNGIPVSSYTRGRSNK